MRNAALALILITLLLGGCNLPSGPVQPTTPTVDSVATEVSLLLTQMPTATLPVTATAAPTNTSAAAEPTATITAAPAATDAAAPSPTPSATPAANSVRSSLGTPSWTDSLEMGKSFYQYDNDNTKVVMRGGALELTGLNADGWMGWSLTFSQKPQNFYLDAVFSQTACSGADIYGLVFRAPNTDSGYFFGVTCDGRYSLRARDFADGTNIAVVELTQNAAIHSGAGQTNRLAVRASGNKIELFANDTLLQEVTDSRFGSAGNFGAFVAANNTPGFTAKMEEISLWNLP
jgi:hypothetical protein